MRHQGTTAEKRQEILQSQVDEGIQKLVDAGHGAVAMSSWRVFGVSGGGVRRESEKGRRWQKGVFTAEIIRKTPRRWIIHLWQKQGFA